MFQILLVSGAPDEPSTGDWDALCDTPGPNTLIAALFRDLAAGTPRRLERAKRRLFASLLGKPVPGLPGRSSAETSEDDTHRVHTIWLGGEAFGARVTETQSVVSTMFPMYCQWETFGLPGTKLIWDFKLDYAGQLGYAAFRHDRLVCTFKSAADQRSFAEIWQRVLGKTPGFEPLAAG
jgi:hypothetical protein